ncbi:MAG: bifunctional 5,10-methylenetetrahydrofolate dehydrogenase/5,10-methenyltetrahydrofolate cyclohydrolase [Chloroflexota bacterium]
MSHKLLKGKDVARPIREDIMQRVAALGERGWIPSLASIEVGDNPAAKLYIRNQRRAAERLDIVFEERQFPSNISTDELVAAITAMNVDPRITGIILQRPLPHHIDLGRIQTAITASKDVEGMHPANIGKVVYDDYVLGPCTSLASVECLKATGMELRGLEVVVVGHSEIVGKPLGLHLMGELATVTVCHHGTRNLATHTRRADAVFVAVGKPGLITGNMIKPGAAVIDIGINQIEVENEDGDLVNKTVGDVDFDSAHEVAGWITPVPGGVGPVTLSVLMRNTVAAVEAQMRVYEERMLAGD